MLETIQYSEIRKDVAYENTASNYCTVTNLADFMVKEYGISFKNAHDIMGDCLGELDEQGLGIQALDAELVRKCCLNYLPEALPITAEQVRSVLDPLANVESKVTIGGPQVASVERMIANQSAAVAAQQAWLDAARGKLQSAADKLDAEVTGLMK